MKAKKLFLANMLCRTGMLRAIHFLTGPSLVVLNYHRIRGGGSSGETAFDEGVFGPNALQFERQMEWISNNTEVLAEADVIERLVSGKKFGAPSSLVTFDDGYVDNYQIAFPILARLAIPAIFFIPTALISSRQVGWWDIIAYLVKRSTRSHVSVDGEVIPIADRNEAIRRLIRKVKQQTAGSHRSWLEGISDACGVPIPAIEVQSRELMSWEQIREVSRGGVSIGSHTHSHTVLSNLGREGQREELRISKEILERELGKRVRSVAYPVGGRAHYGRDSMSLVAECGYEMGFCFHGGVNRGSNLHRYQIERLGVPHEWRLMAASILLPRIFD
jgi:peptidoglycan/xylan/chitin deacetylase (PgdA/CDA1 family)